MAALETPKVMRRLITAGKYYDIECAVLEDGESSPASDALDELKSGFLAEDPDHAKGEPWPDENQTHDYFQLMAMFKLLADEGEPMHAGAVNALEEGIWEFKQGVKRFSFYDTDGAGGFEPKYRISDYEYSDAPESAHWWFPMFDEYVRLGYVFMKTDVHAGTENVAATIETRKVDLAHDR
jgi:hypothetical protein